MVLDIKYKDVHILYIYTMVYNITPHIMRMYVRALTVRLKVFNVCERGRYEWNNETNFSFDGDLSTSQISFGGQVSFFIF